MSPSMIGVLGIVGFLILLLLRLPIAISMAVTGVVGYAVLVSPEAALRMVSTDLFNSFNSYNLSVIPMFIWMGYLAFESGIGSRLYTFAYKAVGRMPGGLAMASQVAGAIFGAVCGSSTATAATIGSMAIPEMRKYKYDDSLAAASVAAAGGLGVMIPPSVIFVVYGISTEQSIGKLLLSGLLPGILLTVLYMATIRTMAWRHPEIAPSAPKFSAGEVLDSLRGGIIEVLIIFIISMGGLFAGLFSPTEAAAVGSFGVLLVTVLGRKMTWQGFKNSIRSTTRTSAMIMFLVGGATVFGRFLAVSRLPFDLATWTAGLPLTPWAVMGVIFLIYLFLGMLIDALPMILLTIPIFFPIVTNVLNFDPIWFGVTMVLITMMGVITPPVGMNVYVVKGVARDIPLETIFRGIWPFVLAQFVGFVLLLIFPQIATVLPNMLIH